MYPNEILEDLLYLGDANHATSPHAMKNLKITHIANITDVIPNAFEGPKIKYLKVSISDLPDVQIIDNFPDFFWFLEEAYDFNQNSDFTHNT